MFKIKDRIIEITCPVKFKNIIVYNAIVNNNNKIKANICYNSSVEAAFNYFKILLKGKWYSLNKILG